MEMSNKQIVEDLKAIKAGFMEDTKGSYPICLDKAIEIIENLDSVESGQDKLRSYLEERIERYEYGYSGQMGRLLGILELKGYLTEKESLQIINGDEEERNGK